MQVVKIIKDTAKSRVFFYDKNDVLLFSADATTAFSANPTDQTVHINFDAEGSLPASFGWSSGLISLGVDVTPPVLQSGTFVDFLTALKDTYFSQSASGGSGGGGGGSATENKQNDQLATMGAPSDSPTTNPFSSSTQTALQKGIFANGLRGKSFEQVIDSVTGAELWRFIDHDPLTPPTAAVYIDPLTGLVTSPPANPVYPVVSVVTPTAQTQAFSSSFPIAGVNATIAKIGKGELQGGMATNNTATAKFIHFYNFSATIPNATTNIGTKILTISLPAQVGASVVIPKIPFSVGLSFLISTNANPAASTAVPANALNLTFIYS